jgi:hypothetical protein
MIKKLLVTTLFGAAAFWLANFAISLTPIAAEYRTALGISYNPMLLEALAGGLIIGFSVSFILLRFHNRIPFTSPLSKSIWTSLILLALITLTLGNPKTFSNTSNPSYYFMIGTFINVIRILFLGLVIGCVCQKQKRFVDNL